MPNLVPSRSNTSFRKIHNDFIPHPRQFPLEFKRTRGWHWFNRNNVSADGDIGLTFFSTKYIPAGAEMEIAIPLRGDTQKFHGTVVMVREIDGGYEIGLWLATQDDASRARLVEQICHMECSLQQRQVDARPKRRKRPAAPAYGGRLPQQLLAN